MLKAYLPQAGSGLREIFFAGIHIFSTKKLDDSKKDSTFATA